MEWNVVLDELYVANQEVLNDSYLQPAPELDGPDAISTLTREVHVIVDGEV